MAVVDAITIFEKYKSRNGKQSPEDPSIDIVYGVLGTDDENDMNTLVDATAPATWNDLQRQDWTHEYLGGVGMDGAWEVTVHYDRKDPKGAGTNQFSFDMVSGTQHITQSKETMDSQAPFNSPLPPPDFQGGINVTDDNVEGCDVTSGKMEFTVTSIALAADLPPDFLMQIRTCAATAPANDRPFSILYRGQVLQFVEYELLFMGASGSYRGDGSWEFNFKFSASATVQNQEIGSGASQIIIALKRGWDYLWVKYKKGKDNPSKVFAFTPMAAYVERVYDATDFDDLFEPFDFIP
jgi:hypothetical protein